MEANVAGLILSSGHGQVGRDKSKGIVIGAQRSMFPQLPTPQKSNKVLFPVSFGGIV